MKNTFFSTTLRVRYSETDQMGVVYHGNYLNWFEVGRTEMLRALGQDYRTAEEKGLKLPVLNVRCSFLRPALYDDMVEIRTRIEKYTGVKLSFQYEICRDGELLVTGDSSHCWTNANFKPIHLKKIWQELHELIQQKTLEGV
ncbi:acyl-CoA thioesterase [Caldalkalibacillus mannanilyticus]|uniref:acyl-CoA thioesterase n=1 Tax=Caldalkalibacillus mannanilyticus TaxID=1418 RepID=UPI00046AA7B0|nr:thioesterase family protein [Caldalkalibacillus mannanilyticus]